LSSQKQRVLLTTLFEQFPPRRRQLGLKATCFLQEI
jgi:hypothetical protein